MTQTRIPGRRPVAPARDELDELSGEIDVTTVTEEYEKTRGEQRGGSDFVTLEQGENELRFLPPRPGQKVPWVRFYQHRIAGSNPQGSDKDGWDRNILCVASVPAADGSKRVCPICKARDPIYLAGLNGDDVSKQNAQALRAKLKVITEVVNYTSEEELAKGVQLFGYGTMIDEALVGLLTGKYACNFTSAKNGCPVLITREGQKLNTKYKNIKAVTENKGPIDVEFLRDRQDLSRFLKLPTAEEMAEAMAKLGLGKGNGNAGRVQRPAAPPQRPVVRSAPKPAPAPVIEEDVEEYDADFDVE